MSEPYYRQFWIVSDKGRTLFPKLIVDRDTGVARYQFLAKGSNDKGDGDATDDPLEFGASSKGKAFGLEPPA